MEHTGPVEATTRTTAPLLPGLDRVLWQRVEVDEHGPVGALVAGTRRRRPTSVRVDPATALALVESGVPTVTRRVVSDS